LSQSYETQEDVDVASETKDEKPAIGIIATGDNDDEVARVCLRAHSRGYDVFIAYEEGVEPSLPEAARLDNTTVVPAAADSGTSAGHESVKSRLEVAARMNSANSLLLVEDPSARIDFEESLKAFDTDTYLAEAVPEPAVGVQTLIAIPAYNEAATIGSVVEQASAHADGVLVIDDGSSDETAARAEEAGAVVVGHEQNQGYGSALQTAFETAETYDADCLVIIDGDGQHDSADIPVLAEKVSSTDANVAIGSRFAGENEGDIPVYRRFGINVINVMSNLSMGAIKPTSWISDTQSGFRAYDEEAIEALANTELGDDMDASLDILYHLHEEDFEIEEMPTVVDYDVEDGHSQNPVAHGLSLVSTILRTVEREHPVKFLGVPGFFGTLLGLGFAYATIANYITTATFPLGLGLVSVFFILAGVFASFTAIILHSLNQLHD
jgi:glycosyltransferase involved in cell wall biosynthesis